MELDKLDIPKSKITQLTNNNINSLEDILKYIPNKYYDFRNITSIKDIKDGEILAIVGTVYDIKACKGNMYYAKVRDTTGTIMINWFGSKYIYNQLKKGIKYIFCGKSYIDKNFHNLKKMNLMYFDEDISKYQKIIPIYKKIKNMSDDYLKKIILQSFSLIKQQDYLEDNIKKKFQIINQFLAFKYLHQPRDMKEIEAAKKRFLFDDLFTLSYKLNSIKRNINIKSNVIPLTCKYWTTLIKNLGFEMTEDQKHTIKDIFVKMRHKKQINALIQGDVGSGKTIIAIFLMLAFAENNFQSCLMAPTEILAKQHYEEIKDRFKDFPFEIVFLSGKLKAKERRKVLEKIKLGTASIVVGTHAIISKEVEFSNLGLVIIDEEHKFGVIQRETLINKSSLTPHCITLSATPIPRTLANVLYSNCIDIYTIKSKPKGRKEIKTMKILEEEEIYNFIYKEIQKGRQCYIVCPLIEKSESDKMENVESVEEVYKKTTRFFKNKSVNISIITGKMKEEEINNEISKFKNNLSQILISTTIIEVGVNVPNATVMLIKNAERFGLSQLHQLRGRVGRSDLQSYCILQSNKDENHKLDVMCNTNDGFAIAYEDLKIRGTGEFLGTKQSGDNKYINLMLLNQDFYKKINDVVINIEKDKYKFLEKLKV